MTALDGPALHQRCLEAVVEEGERVGILAAELEAGLVPGRAGLDVPVPWTPGWTARDLVGHLATVHRWATVILRAGTTDPPPRNARRPPPADGLLDWYAEGLAALVATLRTTPPEAPAWHMSPLARPVAGEWARRQAHELAVHRMDLEAAAGMPLTPLDPALAEDGVDELLRLVLARWAHLEPVVGARATVGVVSSDSGRSWSVHVDRGTVTVTDGSTGSEDARLEAPATALLLHLWGRPAEVSVGGDPAAEAVLRGR